MKNHVLSVQLMMQDNYCIAPLFFPRFLEPLINRIIRSGNCGNTYCEQVPAFPVPEDEITAGADILIHHVLIGFPGNNKKVEVLFHPVGVDRSESFFPPQPEFPFDCGPIVSSSVFLS